MKNFVKTAVLFLCVASLLCGCGSTPVTPKDPLTDSETVRVMSFNVCGWDYKNIKNMAPQLIAEYSPDLVGLQECTYDWYKKLTKELPEYGFVGVGRENGKLDKNSGESCGILYKTDRFTLQDSGTFWLSETPEEPSKGWDGDYIRICTWAVFKDNATGEEVALVNTHLENIDDGTGQEALEKGIQMVLDKIASFQIPVILTGDLNFEKDSQYHAAVTAAGLRDSQDLAESTMEGVTCPTERGGDTGEHIDYIFTKGVSSVLTYKIIHDTYDGKYPSDHYPIYADMKF